MDIIFVALIMPLLLHLGMGPRMQPFPHALSRKTQTLRDLIKKSLQPSSVLYQARSQAGITCINHLSV